MNTIDFKFVHASEVSHHFQSGWKCVKLCTGEILSTDQEKSECKLINVDVNRPLVTCPMCIEAMNRSLA